jgi:hypothetical protein
VWTDSSRNRLIELIAFGARQSRNAHLKRYIDKQLCVVGDGRSLECHRHAFDRHIGKATLLEHAAQRIDRRGEFVISAFGFWLSPGRV